MAENNENMSVNEAGEKGGEKVSEERGPEFYAEIGRKGGHSRGKEKNPDDITNRQDDSGDMSREDGEE